MAQRSNLQRRKASEEAHNLRVAETLARNTRVAEEKAAAGVRSPDDIGRELELEFGDVIKRPYSSFTKKLKTKNPEAITLKLALHMMGDYPVPEFIQSAFIKHLGKVLNTRTDIIKMAKQLFILTRGGGSVHKEVTKDFLTKKETHRFLQAPKDLTIQQAIVFAQATSDTDRGLALRIARSRVVSLFGRKISREVVRFFALNECSIHEINDIVDYITHAVQENPNYSMKGRSLTSMRKAHNDWVRDLGRMKGLGNYSWEGLGFETKVFRTQTAKDHSHEWKFYEILNTTELHKEGKLMRHCVSSYAPRCRQGRTSIVTMRHRIVYKGGHAEEFGKCMTIEVTDHQVVQVRGFVNRLPEKHEKEAVRLWMAENNLRSSQWSGI